MTSPVRAAPAAPPTAGAASPAPWLAALERQLGPLLGDFTAKMALQTAAQRACKRPLDALTPEDGPALLEGLRPMLNTFLGVARAKAVLEALGRAAG